MTKSFEKQYTAWCDQPKYFHGVCVVLLELAKLKLVSLDDLIVPKSFKLIEKNEDE